MPELRKREIGYKLRIGELLRGNQIFDSSRTQSGTLENIQPRLLHVELGDKKISRVNVIANVIDKFESQGETRFATITLDDGSGQIRAKVFGGDIVKFNNIIQGDTVVVIGFLRTFNKELYILPEIVRKHDPRYLLVRKLEIDKANRQFINQLNPEMKKEIKAYREEIMDLIKEAEKNHGIDKEDIIMKFKVAPEIISQEIQKLLEDGIIYEPTPGRVRYLG